MFQPIVTRIAVAQQVPVQPETPPEGEQRRLLLVPRDHFDEGQGLDALELLALETWSECRDGTSCLERSESQTGKAEEGDNQEVDVKGIDLAADLITKAFDIFSKRLGFEPSPAPKPSEPTSKLRTTNKESQSSALSIPVA